MAIQSQISDMNQTANSYEKLFDHLLVPLQLWSEEHFGLGFVLTAFGASPLAFRPDCFGFFRLLLDFAGGFFLSLESGSFAPNMPGRSGVAFHSPTRPQRMTDWGLLSAATPKRTDPIHRSSSRLCQSHFHPPPECSRPLCTTDVG